MGVLAAHAVDVGGVGGRFGAEHREVGIEQDSLLQAAPLGPRLQASARCPAVALTSSATKAHRSDGQPSDAKLRLGEPGAALLVVVGSRVVDRVVEARRRRDDGGVVAG